jgi:predicted RNase H-like nuclease (RuvC/YqgF family)
MSKSSHADVIIKDLEHEVKHLKNERSCRQEQYVIVLDKYKKDLDELKQVNKTLQYKLDREKEYTDDLQMGLENLRRLNNKRLSDDIARKDCENFHLITNVLFILTIAVGLVLVMSA